jgi:hypothetical protein
MTTEQGHAVSNRSTMIYAEHGTLRYRQINALSWRVASELSRRDPGVYIGLTGDGGSAAHADSLMMTNAGGPDYQARRCGLGFTAGSGGDFQIPWDRALGMPSARAIAIALEESQGIHRPEKSPVTTPRAPLATGSTGQLGKGSVGLWTRSRRPAATGCSRGKTHAGRCFVTTNPW